MTGFSNFNLLNFYTSCILYFFYHVYTTNNFCVLIMGLDLSRPVCRQKSFLILDSDLDDRLY